MTDDNMIPRFPDRLWVHEQWTPEGDGDTAYVRADVALAMVTAEREACAKRGGDAAVEALLRQNPDATPFRQQATRQNIVRAIRSQEGEDD